MLGQLTTWAQPWSGPWTVPYTPTQASGFILQLRHVPALRFHECCSPRRRCYPYTYWSSRVEWEGQVALGRQVVLLPPPGRAQMLQSVLLSDRPQFLLVSYWALSLPYLFEALERFRLIPLSYISFSPLISSNVAVKTSTSTFIASS